MQHKQCLKEDPNISMFLQNWIYCLNGDKERNHVIKSHLAKDMEWLGTWYVKDANEYKNHPPNLVISQASGFIGKNINKPLSDVLQARRKKITDVSKKPVKVFTVCIFYEVHLVHYVSFVYDAKKKTLTSFDPGVELYLHGMQTIVPCLRKIFYDLYFTKVPMLKQDAFTIGRCDYTFNKRKGVQYNGKNNLKLPADAFCQTWTLFFLARYSMDRDASFVKVWCNINPFQRESYVLSAFIIPTIEKSPTIANAYFKMVGNDPKKVMGVLVNYSTKCLFKN